MRVAVHRSMIASSAAIAALALASAIPAVAAQHGSMSSTSDSQSSHNDSASSAQDRVRDATRLVQQMKQDPALASVLQQAKGVFIVPHYGKGGFIVGGQGGGGIVLVKHEGSWSSPAFYSIAGGSIGAQAGGEGGAITMILMTQKAVNRFENSTRGWILNGTAGLTVVNWSGKTQASTAYNGRDDVILWTNTSGLYGGLTVGVKHLSPDTQMDRAYYQRPASSADILAGNVSSPNADALRNALASRVASR